MSRYASDVTCQDVSVTLSVCILGHIEKKFGFVRSDYDRLPQKSFSDNFIFF